MTDRTSQGPQVLLCNCVHYDLVPKASKERMARALVQAGLEVEVVDDLCGLAARRDPRLHGWAQASSLALVACFPRALRWLFHAAGAPPLNDQVRFFNLRAQTPEEIIRELMKDDGLLMIEEAAAASTCPNNQQSTIINHQSPWVPWFPVIDYDRCKNCKQCLNFCLFGVYALSEEGKVQVRKPDGCKTNCPACARMCPQKAIIFPKYGEAPINGAEVPELAEGTSGQPQAVVPAGDIYEKIRQRTAGHKRFAVGSGQPQGGSPANLCPTLESLQRALGVPDDVLQSLSPTEIARIAGQSRQKEGTGNEKGERKKDAP